MKTRTTGSSSRLIRRLLIFAWTALVVGSSWAQVAPVETLVQDTLYRADGKAAHGTLTIRWNGFTTSGGQAVAGGEMTVKTNASGGIAIPLMANTGASPSGSYYRVFMKLDDGTTSEEMWVVPAVATTTIAAIRANVVPQAVAAQFVSRDYVDSALATVDATLATLAPTALVHLNGAETISGAKTFTVSPEVPAPADAGAAVDKAYVDQGFSGLATVASTGNYNDLSNKPPSANLAAPGAIGSQTPGSVNATQYSVNGVPLASANLTDSGSLVKTNQPNTFSQPQTVTFTGSDAAVAALMVDASNSSIATNPVLKVALPPSGGQRAMQAINGSDSKAWYSLEYNAGGTGLPGIGLGPGGSATRDAFLYRSAANALTTPGSFTAAKINSTVQIAPGMNGVVGDGVTDDTMAIQNVENAAIAAGNGTDILISPGTYGVCNLGVYSGITFRGLGTSAWRNTIGPVTPAVLFQYSAACIAAGSTPSSSLSPVIHIVNSSAGNSTLSLNGPTIENIGILDNTNGTHCVTLPATAHCGAGFGAIWGDNVVKGTLRKVGIFEFTNPGAYGILINQYSSASDESYWTLDQPFMRNVDTGIILDGLSDGMVINGGEIAGILTAGLRTNTNYSPSDQVRVLNTSFELSSTAPNAVCADLWTWHGDFEGRCEALDKYTGIGVHLEAGVGHNHINPVLNYVATGVLAEAGSYDNEIHLARLNTVTTPKVDLGDNEWEIPGVESTHNDNTSYPSLYGYFEGLSVMIGNTTSVQGGLLGRYGAILRNAPKNYFILGAGGITTTGTSTLTVTTPAQYGMVAGETVFLQGAVEAVATPSVYPTATASLTGNAVSGLTIVGGSGWAVAPNVVFSGGGGSGAAATLILANGVPTGYTITAGGTGYTSAPTVSFTGGSSAVSGPCTGLVVVNDSSAPFSFTCTLGNGPVSGSYNYGSMWAAGGLWESGVNSTQASVGAGAMNFSAAGGTATGVVASGLHFNPAGSTTGQAWFTCDSSLTIAGTFTPTPCMKITAATTGTRALYSLLPGNDTVGSTSGPYLGEYIGNSTSAYTHVSSNATAARTFSYPDANSNPVQPLAATPAGGQGCVGYIDSNGVQQPCTAVAASTATTATTATNLAGGAVGSILYQTGAGATGTVAGNTAATDQVVVSHGSGSAALAPTLTNAPALSAVNMTGFPTLNQSTTGNAATATALASAPSACASGQVATGISANGTPTCTYIGKTVLRGWCGSTATASATLILYNLGQTASSACTQTVYSSYGAAYIPTASTVTDLAVIAGAVGVNSSDGVFQVYNGSTALTGATCTLGIGSFCHVNGLSVAVAAQGLINVRFTTQSGTTISNVQASVSLIVQ